MATFTATAIRTALLVGTVWSTIGDAQAVKIADLRWAATPALTATPVRATLLASTIWRTALLTNANGIAGHAGRAHTTATAAAIGATLLPRTIGTAPRTTAAAVVFNASNTNSIPEVAATEGVEGADTVGHGGVVAARGVVFRTAITTPTATAPTTTVFLYALDTQGIPLKRTAVVVKGTDTEFNHEVAASSVGMFGAAVATLGNWSGEDQSNKGGDKADCPARKEVPHHNHPHGDNAGLQNRRPA